MAQLLAKRGDYFPSLHGYPFLVANYPPVFVGLTAAGMGLLGPGLFAPRLLSALATLGLLGVLYPLLRRLSGRRDVAVALTLTFLLPWFVTTWAPLGRVDMLAFLLSLSGLAVVERHGAGSRAWPALPLFWPAFFTKQTTLTAPAAVLLDLGFSLAHFAYASRERLPRAVHHPDRAREENALARLVREALGPVVSENLSVLVANRRPVLMEPFGMLLLVRHGLLRPDVVVRDCEARRFALVVTETRLREIPGFGDCLDRAYEPVADLGPYQAFEPRPRPSRPD